MYQKGIVSKENEEECIRVVQLSSPQPSLQTHRPSRHVPCPQQSFGQPPIEYKSSLRERIVNE
jgi:hypothetical protein